MKFDFREPLRLSNGSVEERNLLSRHRARIMTRKISSTFISAAVVSVCLCDALFFSSLRSRTFGAKRVATSDEASEKRSLYPLAEVQKKGYLEVSDGHEIYYEVRGMNRPDLPVALWLHGGPGAGCFPNHARFCDPERWRVVLLDQRGCGRSRPTAEIDFNTTPHLIDDLEKLRMLLSVDAWGCVVGGSWGSTLALAYSQSFPESVRSLVLRGVCGMRPKEIRWLFSPSGGAAQLAPSGWKRFEKLARDKNKILTDEDDAVLHAYYDMLRDPALVNEASSSWQRWEFQASAIADKRGPGPVVFESTVENTPNDSSKQRAPSPAATKAAEKRDEDQREESSSYLSRLEADSKKKMRALRPNAGSQPLLTCHYSVHRGFFDETSDVIRKENVEKIRHIPAIAVQGGADVICPATTAFELKEVWPELELRLCPGAGHSQYHPDIKHELLQATDAIASKLSQLDSF